MTDHGYGYFDPDGNEISVLEWGERFENLRARTMRTDEVVLPAEVPATLVTVWLGHVDPLLPGARLFGSAYLIDGRPQQLQLYDSRQEAEAGHQAHLDALAAGYHCDLCRRGEQHNND